MQARTPATLVFEDGSIYRGAAFGAQTDAVFELVFNTSMTGYQEILTDPSYHGQGVLFTVSHVGNVGINTEDYEAAAPQVEAMLIRALSPLVSNWRASADLSAWLAQHGVPGIAEIDTRAITRKLRDGGTMKAALSTKGTDADTLLKMAREWPGLDGRDMVKEVTCAEPYHWVGDAADKWVVPVGAGLRPAPTYHVVLYDFGAKYNIARHLSARGASVTIVSADTTAEQVLALKPDGVMLSNGPGDPAGVPYAAEAVKKLIDSNIPIFGICLGHQLIGLALGGKTARLKFGHHGGNHPVQDLRTKGVYVTSQNHNFMVLPESLDPDEIEITHLSLNDNSLEGLKMKNKPVYSVQFHPEASPGPQDAHEIFEPFFATMRERAENRE
ncbi:MAG: glutamine-hydrolyzing carbamoyl-phosphate synthase small subunit [Anaerolineales bacterium]